MHQTFISAPMEARTTAKRRDASKSRVVGVLSSANGGDVVEFIPPALVSPAPNRPGAGVIWSELGAALNLFASPSLPPSASSSIYIAIPVFFFIVCTQ